MATYAMAMDSCRFADVGACFAPDAEWITNYGAARGPDEIAKFIGGIVPVKGEGPQRKHYITNIIIKVDGDTASAVSDYLVVRESENGLLPVMGGTYRDKFVKTPPAGASRARSSSTTSGATWRSRTGANHHRR
jgi:hypothetical protein